MNITSITRDILDFIYPRCCVGCGNMLMTNESEICLQCIYKLPKLTHNAVDKSLTEKIFWGRVRLEQAQSFLHFSKGSLTQKIMHAFKYQDRQEIGKILGRLFGSHIKDNYFKAVDLVIPVPLHPLKLEKRGFNQSELFAEGLSESLSKPMDVNILSRRIYSNTQTRKGRYERWKNVEDIFKLNIADAISGKHILLVDDIVTTGATLEAASITLRKAKHVKISIATLAIAEGA